jgi:hypothetical protein
MSETPISPLRRRLIEDMTVRHFRADTQRNYVRGGNNLAIFWVDRRIRPRLRSCDSASCI